MDLYQLTSGQMKAIREMFRAFKAQMRSEFAGMKHQQVQRRLTVVLDEALDAATNALTTPGTAVASVLRKNSSGNLEDSGNNINVVNRYESIDLEQYTIGVAAWIDGEWRIDSADCTALGDWP
jgi:hypothetical protein